MKRSMSAQLWHSTTSRQLTQKWIDTDKEFEGEPMHIRLRIVAREFKSGDRPDLYAGAPPLEALKAIISIAASHSPEFSLMHVDVSRVYFHAKAQRPVLVKLPENRTAEEEHVRHRAPQKLGCCCGGDGD